MKYLNIRGKLKLNSLTFNEGDRPDGSIFYLDSEWSYRYFRLPTVIDRLYRHDEEPELSSRSVSTTYYPSPGRLYLHKASLGRLGESHPDEGGGESLCVHLAARALQVLLLPLLHVGAGGDGSHGEQVGHHAAEPGGQAGLGYEAELELRLEQSRGEMILRLMGFTDQTDYGVPGLVPGGNVQQVGLVVVEQQLDDHPRVLTEVFDGDDSHDV